MPAPVLITTDLDQTLIFSRQATRRLGGGLPADIVEETGGQAISEIAMQARDSLRALPPHAHLCPATTRTVSQLVRLRLPVPVRYAIAANGGTVLIDGEPDAGWAARMHRALVSVAPLSAAQELLAGLAGSPWLLHTRHPDDLFSLAIVDPAALRSDELGAVSRACAAMGWRASLHGRKLYLLPAVLRKESAAAFVADRIAAAAGTAPRRFAAGDTLLDEAMLDAADLAWIPAGSELARHRHDGSKARVTRLPGHAAAAQITREWLDAS